MKKLFIRVTPLVQTWDMGKKTISVLVLSFFLPERANSGYILFPPPDVLKKLVLR